MPFFGNHTIHTEIECSLYCTVASSISKTSKQSEFLQRKDLLSFSTPPFIHCLGLWFTPSCIFELVGMHYGRNLNMGSLV